MTNELSNSSIPFIVLAPLSQQSICWLFFSEKQWTIWLDVTCCNFYLTLYSDLLLIQGSPNTERLHHIQTHLRCDLRGRVVCFHWQSSRHSPLVVSENSHLLKQCKGDKLRNESVKQHEQWWAATARAVKKSSYRLKMMRNRNVFCTKGESPGRFTSQL